tara:strand:+ start:156 stop:920 length:765 start_codon:yes stop_codon:yes gene_type:complete
MKIAIAQLHTENLDDWAYIAVENKQNYARANNYDFVYKRGLYETPFEQRHPSWHSIRLILEILHTTDVDWVFWSDVDALIMDYTVRLEDFIKPEYDMIIPTQGQGEYCGVKTRNCLCCGHYFVKNTEWSKKFLKTLWDWPKDDYYKYRSYSYWEQCGMNYLYSENTMDFTDHVYIEKQNRAFNSFYYMDGQHRPMQFTEWGETWFRTKESKEGIVKNLGAAYNDGDFIIHFAGKHCSPYRKELMKEYKGKVKWS